MNAELYRKNVCAVIRNGNSVLVCHRNDSAQDTGWQFPQGGLESEDDNFLIDELKRELREEIGNDQIRVIRTLPGWYYYDLPDEKRLSQWGGKYLGQRQRWVLCEFLENEPLFDFNTHSEPEFDGFKWVTPLDAYNGIAEFKKEVYLQAMKDFGLI